MVGKKTPLVLLSVIILIFATAFDARKSQPVSPQKVVPISDEQKIRLIVDDMIQAVRTLDVYRIAKHVAVLGTMEDAKKNSSVLQKFVGDFRNAFSYAVNPENIQTFTIDGLAVASSDRKATASFTMGFSSSTRPWSGLAFS